VDLAISLCGFLSKAAQESIDLRTYSIKSITDW
jgi:hypothetical protein